MKIKDLITSLCQHDPNMEVIVYHDGYGYATFASDPMYVDHKGIVDDRKMKNSEMCFIVRTLS
jgi:hypothetical protein